MTQEAGGTFLSEVNDFCLELESGPGGKFDTTQTEFQASGTLFVPSSLGDQSPVAIAIRAIFRVIQETGKENQWEWEIVFKNSGALSFSDLLNFFFQEISSEFPPVDQLLNSTPVISELNFRYKSLQHTQEFNFDCKLSGTLSIEGLGEIRDIALDFSDSHKKLKGKLNFQNKFALDVTATWQKEGWDISGAAKTRENEATLGLFVWSELRSLVPDFLLETKISKIAFLYQSDEPSQTKKRSLSVTVNVPIGTTFFDLTLTFLTEEQQGSSNSTVAGQFRLGGANFVLNFSKKKKENSKRNEQLLIAKTEGPTEINFQEVIAVLLPEAKELIPEGSLTLDQIYFVYQKGKTDDSEAEWLFYVDFKAFSIDFRSLPVFGDKIPGDYDYKVGIGPILISSSELTWEHPICSNLSRLEQIELPPVLQSGFNFSLEIRNALDTILQLPILTEQTGANLEPETSGESKLEEIKPDSLTQEKVDKEEGFKIGPVRLQNFRPMFKDSKIWLLFDPSVSVNGMTMKLIGLGLGINISQLFSGNISGDTFGFELEGLGIGYIKPTFQIQGAFAQKTPTGEEKYKFEGQLIFKSETFGLAILGSYTKFQSGKESLFCFGYAKVHIPVPPCFLITGLALGFGYNYRFLLPGIDKVADCPLIKIAEDSDSDDISLMAEGLDDYLSPDFGHFFVAAGIKFTIFKQIDAYLLAIVSKSGTVEFLGKATLTIPSKIESSENEKPLAKAEFVLLGRIDSDGIFVLGDITENSYILFPECKIRGGFAFYSWTGGRHEGDFVFTIGGYHPRFDIPAHYPIVPRLNFKYRLNSYLTIKGDLYFALTSTAIMAGGRFEAVFDASFGFFFVKAYFILKADFIIAWKPYYYEGRVSIAIGGEIGVDFKLFKESFSVSLRADLLIWGPDFSGKGTVTFKNWIKDVEFDIEFGDRGRHAPSPISWKDFKEGFLSEKDLLPISIKSGLLQELEKKSDRPNAPTAIVNPDELSITVDSSIPFSSKITLIERGAERVIQSEVKKTEVGIAPMDVDALYSECSITLDSTQFDCKVINRPAPEALWGKGLDRSPKLKAPKSIQISGRLEIVPKPPVAPGETGNIPCKVLAYDIYELKTMEWKPFVNIEKSKIDDENRKKHLAEKITAEATAAPRNEVLKAFGIQEEEIENISLSEFADERKAQQAFVIAPKLTVRKESHP